MEEEKTKRREVRALIKAMEEFKYLCGSGC